MTVETLTPYEVEQDLVFDLETEAGRLAGSLSIKVRVWHDDAHGMSAEALRYQLGRSRWVAIGQVPAIDQWISGIVADSYPPEHLDVIRDADPVFASLAFSEPVVSNSKFMHMKGF